MGGRFASAEWHATGAVLNDNNQRHKVSYYVTNFLDNIPLFRLRQAFEVCGILSDVYVARQQNARGQEFGFVRYVNVKNTVKLTHALNNIWVGDCRVWAREARFDRFAHKDVSVVNLNVVGRNEGGEVRLAVSRKGKGVKNVRLGIAVTEKRVEGDNLVTVGKVKIPVGSTGKKHKVRKEDEGVRDEARLLRKEGKGRTGKKKVMVVDGGDGLNKD